MERIGFIGLGIMGVPMVANLVKAGYAPTVWNRSQPGIDACVALGAAAADSPLAAARASDILITIVTDSPDVEDVLVGRDDAAIHGLAEGSVVIDMSTISPAVTRELAAQLSARGVAMLDAPVSGGDTGAKAGTLSIMVGGEADVLERCRPVLEAMGSTITHCGPTGAGQTVKLCNQVAIAGALLGVCEALSLADKSGVDQERMLAAISAGAAGSWQLSNLGPRIAAERLRARLHGPADAEGPAPGVGSGRGCVAAAAQYLAGAAALLPASVLRPRRRGHAGAGQSRLGTGSADLALTRSRIRLLINSPPAQAGGDVP